MIIGGNANAREAFGELALGLKDLKSKYTSKTAQSYKSKLERKAQQPQLQTQQQDSNNLIDFDQPQQLPQQNQQASLIDFDNDSISTAPTKKTETVFDDLDIFKPIHQPSATTTTAKPIFDDLISTHDVTTPVKQSTDRQYSVFDDLISPQATTNRSGFDDLVSSPPSNATNLLVDDDPFDEFISSLNPPQSNSAVDDFFDQFENTSNSSSPKTSKRRQLKPPKSKLGARKVQSNVFQQQTALALEEEKMREQGIDQETIGRTTRNQAFALDQSVSIPKLQQPSSRLVYQPSEQKASTYQPNEQKKQLQDERLGMMSLSLQPKQQPVETEAEEDHFARDKFGNAKAISSDQYFGRNDYDPHRSAANASRLAQFQGSQSISSDQYFGRNSTRQQGNTTMSKKLLRVATKGATKIQNILADMESNMK
jgi:ADP-ribosylation factor GTPase-activating protein 2/3